VLDARGWTASSRIGGVFGKDQSLDLPKQAHRDVDTLSELRAIFDGLYEIANPTKSVPADAIAQNRLVAIDRNRARN
jgi:hypothetical protein